MTVRSGRTSISADCCVDVDGDGVVLDVGLNGQVGEDLDRQHPRFEGSVLLAEEDAVLAGDGEGLERFRMGADDRAGVVERDRSEGSEGGRRA